MPHVEPWVEHTLGHRGDSNEYSKVLSARICVENVEGEQAMCLQYYVYG